ELTRAFEEPGSWTDGGFGEWAVALFRAQCRESPLHAGFARLRGLDPEGDFAWTGIPPVPVSAFRDVRVLAPAAARAERVFRTSGTTGGRERRGEHHVADLALYRAAALTHARVRLLPAGVRPRVVALLPDRQRVLDSSLAWMVGEIAEVLGDGPARCFVDAAGSLDEAGVRAALEEACAEGAPVLLAGTAFAFVHWMDACAAHGWTCSLPQGSRILETGGFKGRSREVPRAELYRGLAGVTGLPESEIVNEYGMTELLSQFYEPAETRCGPVSERFHVGPPWTRTRVLDPHTLEPLPAGRRGLLCHVDLANAHSALAVLTQDEGMALEGGGFRLLGRAAGAEPRGCSLAAEHLLTAASHTRGSP
ncbi:MAG: long-chain fatty acid--CoA ligase, partial [Gemmatimonadetes bacterium]